MKHRSKWYVTNLKELSQAGACASALWRIHHLILEGKSCRFLDMHRKTHRALMERIKADTRPIVFSPANIEKWLKVSPAANSWLSWVAFRLTGDRYYSHYCVLDGKLRDLRAESHHDYLKFIDGYSRGMDGLFALADANRAEIGRIQEKYLAIYAAEYLRLHKHRPLRISCF